MKPHIMKKHAGPALFLIAIMMVFLGRIIFMKDAFLGGDYLVQFYPWSRIYSEAVKAFEFPFWTRYFHSGFPLMAEGQIGGFYPLNIILFFALPFKIAYNYSAVLHFMLAGAFTYMYARKMGAEKWGGMLAALIFCFGSAYAGCFYNTVSMKTLVWCPLVFFLFEEYFKSKKLIHIVFSAVILGMQLLAGFAQFAFYSAVFYLIYFFHGLSANKSLKSRDVVNSAIFLSIAGIMFLPQFLLSWQLAELSSRSSASLGFALWGSFSPLNMMSLCFPYCVFHGTGFYIGVFSILFLITALLYLKTDVNIQKLTVLLAVSIFLGLGMYNPLYILLVKAAHLYAFRNPSKFIFFGVFSASILAGVGFTKFFISAGNDIKVRAARIWAMLIAIILIIFSAGKIALYLFKEKILEMGKWLVSNYIAGRPYHIYDVSTYVAKAEYFYRQLVDHSAVSNVFVASSVILCLGAMLFYFFVNKKRKLGPRLKIISFVIIFADLYIFSLYGTGFRGNIKPFESLNPGYPGILNIIKSDRELFRILPFDLEGIGDVFWAWPNANILESIDSVAVYTPLAERSYKEALAPLQVVDDSLGIRQPADDALIKNLKIMRLLNVKYIVSKRKLSYAFLEESGREGDLVLYKLKGWLPRVFFTHNIEKSIVADPAANVVIKKYESGFVDVELTAPNKGYLVFSENYYPGWHAYIDGVESDPVVVKGLIQGSEIQAGNHKVSFIYKPYRALYKR